MSCGCQATVSPYADSPGEGGGTWLVTGFCETSGIAANDTDLFFISCNDVAHAPAHPNDLEDYQFLDGTGDVMAIAVDADDLYVAAGKDPPHGNPGSGRGVVYKRSVSGGSMVTLAAGNNPVALAIDASNVYWVDAPEETTVGSTTSLVKVPKGGGPTAPLAINLPDVVAIAVDASNVYLATLDSIMSVAKDGSSPPTTIAMGQAHPTAIAADGTTVYWTTQGPSTTGKGALFSAVASSGAIRTLATGLSDATSVAVDAARVYFTGFQMSGQAEGSFVASMPRAGGERKTVGWGQGFPIFLVATPSALYWTDTEGDSLTSGTVKVAESE